MTENSQIIEMSQAKLSSAIGPPGFVLPNMARGRGGENLLLLFDLTQTTEK
jgi:hypothetical protein